MKKIAVIYYSRSGNTEKMAHLVAQGAESVPDTKADIFKVSEMDLDSIKGYDGIALGSPTYYGSMAAPIKDLLDRSVKFHGQLDGKAGAAFSSAANIGGGNETTIMDMIAAFLIHGMVVQGNFKGDHFGTVSIGAPDKRVQDQCRELGKRLALLVKKL